MSSCGITEPGIDGEREQQQQHERRTHRGELAPAPPGEVARVEVGGQRGGLAVVGGTSVELGHTGTQNPRTTPWSHCTSRSHQPVTRRTPTTIIITPPRRTMSIWWRRTTAKARVIRR